MGRSRTGWGTLGEVRDGSEDPRGGPGRVGGPLERSGMGRGTLGKVRRTLREVRDRSEDN